MCRIISFENYRRARRGITQNPPLRARPAPRREGLVSIGLVSAELLRRLMETE